MPYDSCYSAIAELQSNALEKLKQRDRFRDSGVATVKVKVLQGGSSKVVTKEVALTSNGADFKDVLMKELSASVDRYGFVCFGCVSFLFREYCRVKLICGGRVIRDNDTLQNQGVKNGSLVLVLVLGETPGVILEKEKQIKELQNIRADASLLATDDGDYMQANKTNQNLTPNRIQTFFSVGRSSRQPDLYSCERTKSADDRHDPPGERKVRPEAGELRESARLLSGRRPRIQQMQLETLRERRQLRFAKFGHSLVLPLPSERLTPTRSVRETENLRGEVPQELRNES